MRLSDLLHSEVFDAESRGLGQVEDVLVTQSDPLLGGHVGPLVVEGLVVGGGQGTRLGFERGSAQGPWPISAIFRRLERRARFVPWETVVSCDAGKVRLGVTGDNLESPPQL